MSRIFDQVVSFIKQEPFNGCVLILERKTERKGDGLNENRACNRKNEHT